MNLLFATAQSYLPQRVGGVQRSTHELSISLVERGNDVAVLCELNLPFDWTHIQNRMLARMTGRRYPCDRWRPYRVYRGYDATNGVREVAHAFRPDVAIVQAGVAVPLVRSLLEDGIRTILYFRNVEFGAIGGRIPRHPRLRFLANSKFTASRVASELGIEAPVVQPLVCRDAYRTKTSRRHVLFVNPIPKKGVNTAFELARRNPDIPFVFLESWQMPRSQIESLERAVATLPNITLRRATLRMADEYAQARILLVPSVWDEAWGRVVTEAQVNGIPVIASAIGGLPESVGPGGVLIPPGSDIEVWNARLREMWCSAETYRHYQRLAFDHSCRPEIDRDALLNRFLDAVSGW